MRTIALAAVIAFAVAGSAAGAITYEVSAVARTSGVAIPHPTELGRGERHSSGKPLIPFQARRSAQAPVRVSADVTIDGDSIRVDDYVFDPGHGAQPPASVTSIDGGATFDVTEAGTTKPLPIRFALDPTVMIFRAIGAVFDPQTTRIEIDRHSVRPDGAFDGRPATRHRVRARFRITPGQPLRTDPMDVTVELDVRTVDGVRTALPPGFQGWSTGIESVDRIISKTVAAPVDLPVRSVTKVEMIGGRNRQTTVSTLEIKNLRVE